VREGGEAGGILGNKGAEHAGQLGGGALHEVGGVAALLVILLHRTKPLVVAHARGFLFGDRGNDRVGADDIGRAVGLAKLAGPLDQLGLGGVESA
jgi:hypothetical protein